MSLAAMRGEPVDAHRPRPQPSKQFQQTRRPVPAPIPLVLIPDQGEDQDAALVPEIVEDLRRRLAQQARESRDQRRADQRARLHQLLTAPTDEAAPDFVPPASLQEGRQQSSSRVQVTLPRPVVAGPAWGELSADEVLDAAPWVSKGARKVFRVMHMVGVATAQDRRYRVIPSTSAFHLPQLLVAVVVGYTPRHVRRLANELEKAGLIDSGAHASKIQTKLGDHRHLWDGSIWAIKLRPSNCDAYLAPEDWQHQWRDFQADLMSGRTAEKLMSYLKTCEGLARQEHVLKQWAVNPNSKFTSLSLERTFQAEQKMSVQDVVYSLPLLACMSDLERAGAIGNAASAISQALNDGHSRRFWCGLLWAATRNNSLEGFSAQLLRLLADVGESSELRNPGALFAARLRSA
jgi:CRP-like cAMP-binding protein